MTMMSSEDGDLYEATCLDCNTSKSYFSAQGVKFFKMNHEGHQVRAKEPSGGQGAQEEAAAEAPPSAEAKAPAAQAAPVLRQRSVVRPPLEEPEPAQNEPVRLGNLVVDVVEDESGRTVKVYGIAGGRERFTKSFDLDKIPEMNGFLESGVYFDDDTRTKYLWAPEKIDLSIDVARIIDDGPMEVASAPAAARAERQAPRKERATLKVAPKMDEGPKDEMLLGRLSFISPGESYRLEAVRVSNVLKKFRWNTDLPYVVGAIFDDLLSLQSQNGKINADVIEAVSSLGYDFVAVEAPAGAVTAWFRRRGEAPDTEPDAPAEETTSAA